MMQQRSSVSRNTLYNLMGQGALLVAGVATVPLLTRALGVERFALLSLVRVLVIYFSILDFGFTSAVTQRVAEAEGRGELNRIPVIFRTANVFLFWMGILGGLALALSAHFLVLHVLDVPVALHEESIQSLLIAAVAFPFVMLTSSVTGAMQGLQRFGQINLVLAPMNVAQFILPLVAVWVFQSLQAAVAAIFVVRTLACMALYLMVKRQSVMAGSVPQYSRKEFRSLFHFGKWMTVSNIVSPIIGYTDRVFLSMVRPIGHLAYYTVPADIANRLQVFPKSLLNALYPVLSGMDSREKIQVMSLRALRVILVLLAPSFLTVILFAQDLLTLWMGAEFAVRSTLALQIVLPGLTASALGLVPQYVLQSRARTDIIGKIHVWLTIGYVPLGLPVIIWWGVEGAALVWTLRSVAEAALMFWFAFPLRRWKNRRALSEMLTPVSVLFVVQALVSVGIALWVPVGFRTWAWLVIAAVVQWVMVMKILSAEDRSAIVGLVSRKSVPLAQD